MRHGMVDADEQNAGQCCIGDSTEDVFVGVVHDTSLDTSPIAEEWRRAQVHAIQVAFQRYNDVISRVYRIGVRPNAPLGLI